MKIILLLLPLLEIAGFIVVGNWIGVLATLSLIVITTLIGLFILRTQGFATLIQLQRRLHAGEHTAKNALEGALLMFGGLLLIIPGFITDIAGILLLIPVIRILTLRWLIKARILPSDNQTRKQQRYSRGKIIEGEWRREHDKKNNF